MSNTFGSYFRITTFGESHGIAVGCVIDGCPSNLELSDNDIQKFLDLRKPGQNHFTSPRAESDKCKIVSGVYEGKTLGSPICIIIENTNIKSSDYHDINQIYRPGHADYTYAQKYNLQNPPPGGGRASARETIGRVAAGAVAKKYVQSVFPNIKIETLITRVHDIVRDSSNNSSDILTPQMEQCILDAKQNGDSVGGTIQTTIQNLPAGFGSPVFDKLEANLAKAMLSIPAAKFFESGDGINATFKLGSQNNDEFFYEQSSNKMTTKTNFCGGIQGGISNGMPVTFTVGFKPVSTIFKPQQTVSRQNQNQTFTPKSGRHDPCVLPRALIIVESMTWLVLADEILK